MLREIFRDSRRLLVSQIVPDRYVTEEGLRELRSLPDERLAGDEEDEAEGSA